MSETSPVEIDWFAYGREEFRSSLTREEQKLLLHPCDLSIRYDEAIEWLLGGTMTPPLSWDFSAAKDRTMTFRLQSFIRQACLLDEFFRTGDAACRDLLLAWVFDWIDAHPTVDLSDLSAWHDDAAGRRALYFGLFLLAFEKVMSEEQIRRLKACLAAHADLLRSEAFYRPLHNHGFYQDMALTVYALISGEDADYWSALSAARIRMYLDAKISGEGVHLEHSPIYHTVVARGVAWLAVAFRSLDPDYAAELTGLLDQMSEYGRWIALPNGALPSVGDSPREIMDTSVFTGNAPMPERMRVFPQAGYAFIRKDRGNREDGTWMMFLAATHGEVHKHNDDLSFLLYHRGEAVITEAGKRDYHYREPETEYCYSSFGHNVLFVNGEGWKMKPTGLPLLEEAAYATGIVDWEDSPQVSSVTGRQIRFPGVIQVRTLRYDRRSDVVTAEDRIAAEQPAAFRLIYHLAPGIAAEREGPLEWRLFRGGAALARLRIRGNAPELTARLLTESEPPWRAEVYWGKPEPRRGSLLLADWKAEKAGQHILRLRIELLRS